MRPPNPAALERLKALLARQAGTGVAALSAALSLSPATVRRLLASLGDEVVTAGQARRARYGLRRALRGHAGPLPVYEIDASGKGKHSGQVELVRPQGSLLDVSATGWPIPEESRDGWWDGLPYPLYDMRPQGYMGRQFARAEHRLLQIPANPDEWTDDDVLVALSRLGHDLSGSLIVGDAAYEHWMQERLRAPQPLKPAVQGAAYAELAEQAVAGGVAGSSAAGEFPKFTATRSLGGSQTPHVLVKFSGAGNAPAVRRWADLLVCEHLALECAAQLPGWRSARSRILAHAGRTFLELERFDRHGDFGRSRLNSLEVINAALLGDSSFDWTKLAQRLGAIGLLAEADVGRIEHLWWFGRLIANTDMHLGNLSFVAEDGVLAPAPVYDMVPMLYAPLPGGEVPLPVFEVPLPKPPQAPAWKAAFAAASCFWALAAADSRISAPFRRQCGQNEQALMRAAEHV